MGLTTEQIHFSRLSVLPPAGTRQRPAISPLMRQAQVVSSAALPGGATPREFCTITVTDGIAMGMPA
jgi:dihydroxy-acid dehydratase